MLLYYCLS